MAVLLAPVGGYYTIGPEEARDVAEKLGALVVIPMHYKTEDIGFPAEELAGQFGADRRSCAAVQR